MKSVDFGMTWSKLPYDMVPYAVGVLANGDLVVSDDGRLMVIPRDKIDGGVIEQSMIRMSIGGSVPEAACGQRTFRPIVCDGMNILTLTSDGWNMSDSSRDSARSSPARSRPSNGSSTPPCQRAWGYARRQSYSAIALYENSI
jgi:hypothetical protein